MAVQNLIVKHTGGKAILMHEVAIGRYSCSFHLELDNGEALMRIPLSHHYAHDDVKIQAEANMMRFIADNTNIPVPKVYYCGTAKENPSRLGPFIIMEYIPHTRTLLDLIEDPETGHLHDELPEETLRAVYSQMANIMLQLGTLSMPEIGTLTYQDGVCNIQGRPVTENLTATIVYGDLPTCILADKSHQTSRHYFNSLADLHLAHFLFQRNTAVRSKNDGKDKYLARRLFATICGGKKFERVLRKYSDSYPERFKLICDKLNPGSVLIDSDNNVVGVIDWEFAYFGPEALASMPPWWLMIRVPERWDIGSGYHEWAQQYPEYLNIFLDALEEQEEAQIASTYVDDGPDDDSITHHIGKLTISPCWGLSQRMRDNWDSGDFWLFWAACNSYSFDPAYWKHIDERFHGLNISRGFFGRWRECKRSAVDEIERVVDIKLEEKKRNRLIPWSSKAKYKELARNYLERCIGLRYV